MDNQKSKTPIKLPQNFSIEPSSDQIMMDCDIAEILYYLELEEEILQYN
jgi:hypothetical protein